MHTRRHGVAILAFCFLQATVCMYLSEPSRGSEAARLGDQNLRAEASNTLATHGAANGRIGENSEGGAKPKLRISRPFGGTITKSNGKTEITLTAGAKLKVGSEEWKKSETQSMRKNFQLLRQTVAILKHRITRDYTYVFFLRSEKTRNFLDYIEELESVHEILLTPIQNRLFRLKDHSLIISPHELEFKPAEVATTSQTQAAKQNSM
ncbi:hypothetical protein PGTUg99_005303 [Puccinia graminis f. sp. tritici]|uniref:Uncharacterized protein n=1 Tax=Puccinia graminis f. sp. tritici TaxID=56615 RepID=A0A5B0RJQ1_PUCGR|nr:hypothetical protein PGTUg99_005303 [Puccinia graminis f. sp. tritici]